MGYFLGSPFSLFIWILYFTWTLIWASSSSLPSSSPAMPGEYQEHLSLCHRQVLFPDTLRKFLFTFLNVSSFRGAFLGECPVLALQGMWLQRSLIWGILRFAGGKRCTTLLLPCSVRKGCLHPTPTKSQCWKRALA